MNITLENRKLFEGAIANIGTRTLMSDEQRKAYWASKKGGGPSNGPRPSTPSPNGPKPVATDPSNGPGPILLKPTPGAPVKTGPTNKLPAKLPEGMNPYTAALAAAKERVLGWPDADKEMALSAPPATAPRGGDPITWSPSSKRPLIGSDPITWSPSNKKPATTTKYQQPVWSQPKPTMSTAKVDPGLPKLPKKKLT